MSSESREGRCLPIGEPAFPPPLSHLVEATERAIPPILSNRKPSPQGAMTAKKLYERLGEQGHLESACEWALYHLVQKGLVGAEQRPQGIAVSGPRVITPGPSLHGLPSIFQIPDAPARIYSSVTGYELCVWPLPAMWGWWESLSQLDRPQTQVEVVVDAAGGQSTSSKDTSKKPRNSPKRGPRNPTEFLRFKAAIERGARQGKQNKDIAIEFTHGEMKKAAALLKQLQRHADFKG
jgi:hypothetical protein